MREFDAAEGTPVVAPVAAAAVSVALAEASRATRLWTRRERRRCPPVLFAAPAELTDPVGAVESANSAGPG